MKILDHGEIELLQSMGDDLNIVNGARQSFGRSSIKLSKEDKGLIGFLMRERHGTPFELVQFLFQVKCPIFVAREFMRHRIGCLDAQTQITCMQPNGTVYPRSIEHLYRTHHGREASERWIKNGFNKHGKQARTLVPAALRYRALRRPRTLQVLGADGFQAGIMKNIWQSGTKELFLLETKDGKTLRASANHRIKTPDGWAKVSELSSTDAILRMGRIATNNKPPISRRLRVAIQTWTTLQRRNIIGQRASCYLCNKDFWSDALEIDHIVPVFECLAKALDIKNLAPVCIKCHREKTNIEQPKGSRSKVGPRLDRLIGTPKKVAEEMTYDIEMEGPNHNYLANKIIVHNSYNEYSGRYTKMMKQFYVPTVSQCRSQVGKPGAYSFEPLHENTAYAVRTLIGSSNEDQWERYETLLELGVAKEVARMVLPVNQYTQFTWSVNLRALFNFISLRSAESAMWEIRMYSQAIEPMIKEIVPHAWAAFEKNGRIAP